MQPNNTKITIYAWNQEENESSFGPAAKGKSIDAWCGQKLKQKHDEEMENGPRAHSSQDWWTQRDWTKNSPDLAHANRGKQLVQQDMKNGFLRYNRTSFTAGPQRSSPSLYHLIGMKNVFLAHFYTTNAKINLESGKEPQRSRVIYIGPSKMLNDYYAPRA
jgi:hypothetical protein